MRTVEGVDHRSVMAGTGLIERKRFERRNIDMSRFVYLDNAATTSTRKEVVEAMMPYFTENFGNPSSVYDFAAKNKKAVNDSRQTIADALNADVRDIYFTAGGVKRTTGL